jgi:hypothetical protein
MNSITIEQALTDFKMLIDGAILDNGAAGKMAMIRSARPIMRLHEAMKFELISHGVKPELIFPPLGKRQPEIKLAGARKQKNQDVCVVSSLEKAEEILLEGFLENVVDQYGEQFTERTIAINLRSQISSVDKNFDTLYERTISEAENLHGRCPRMCLGEVYLLAVSEYDDKAEKNREIAFKKINPKMIQKYLRAFQAINNRTTTERFFHRYEKACLLLVDFSQNPVKLHSTDDELRLAGLLPDSSPVSISGLAWPQFVPDLLAVYHQRFGFSNY